MLDYYKILNWDTFSVDYFNYLHTNLLPKLEVKTHHDLACGSWIFVDNMTKIWYESSGSNIAFDQIELAKKRYKNIDFLIKDMTDFSLEAPVDLITCNNDAINHLYSFYEWVELFRWVYNNLNNKWYFIFDFHTLEQINNAKKDELKYNKDNFLITFSEQWIGNNFYRSSWRIIDKDSGKCIKILKSYQTSFDENAVYQALKKVWFSRYSFLDISTSKRKYVIAFKERL